MGVAETLPCLVVGAGPTGRALAAQVTVVRVRFRIIDRSFDRAHESRALAIQARTLEILDSLARGSPKRGNRLSVVNWCVARRARFPVPGAPLGR